MISNFFWHHACRSSSSLLACPDLGHCSSSRIAAQQARRRRVGVAGHFSKAATTGLKITLAALPANAESEWARCADQMLDLTMRRWLQRERSW